MDILERFFSIFSEGANDAQYRKEVNSLIDKIKKKIGSIKEMDMFAKHDPRNGSPLVQFNVGRLLGDNTHTNLWLRFDPSDLAKPSGHKGSFAPSTDGKHRIVKLFVDVPSDAFEKFQKDPELWKKVVAKNGKAIIERSVDVLRHEFIHYWDFSRIGDKNVDVFKKTSNSALDNSDKGNRFKKYYNDPLEQNAFIQQGLSRMEDHLNGVDSWEKAKSIMGNDVSAFYQKITKVLSPGFMRHVNDKNKSKLKKRVAQLWNDTKKRLEGGE